MTTWHAQLENKNVNTTVRFFISHSRLKPSGWFSNMFLWHNMSCVIHMHTCSPGCCPSPQPFITSHHTLRLYKHWPPEASSQTRAVSVVCKPHGLHWCSQLCQLLSCDHGHWLPDQCFRFPTFIKSGNCNVRTYIKCKAVPHLWRAPWECWLLLFITFALPGHTACPGLWTDAGQGANTQNQAVGL